MKGYKNADDSYICPNCGAYDSTKCAFAYSETSPHGIRVKDEEAARKIGCRVMYFYDRREQ